MRTPGDGRHSMIDLKRRADQNTGMANVREGFELDLDALSAWMSENVDGFAGRIDALRQFKGGQSNPTYFLNAGSNEYVIRAKPRGALLKSAHAIDREYRVLAALDDTNVPTPSPLALCTDEDVVGAWFYVMSFCPGVVVWDLPTDRWTGRQREAAWRAGAEAAMRLHSIKYEAVGLSDFGKRGGYVARQLKRWSEQYEYTRDGVDNPSLQRLIEWLPDRLPEEEATTIVHGDLQLSNMIMAADLTACQAIVDWELSTLGNPLSDFAYFCRDYHLPIEAGGFGPDPGALGLPAEEEILAAYSDRTGQVIGDDWLYYIVFNMFRLAAIRQGVAKRIKDGTATSANAATAAQGAVDMANQAWGLVERNF